MAPILIQFLELDWVFDADFHCSLHEPFVPLPRRFNRQVYNFYGDMEFVCLLPYPLKPGVSDPFPIFAVGFLEGLGGDTKFCN